MQRNAAGSAEAERLLAALAEGELRIEGRLVDASNATLVARADGPSATDVRCVYKPVAGERPLWDFPDETLGLREVAAHVVSEALGWSVVPPTVWREDGPYGPGMCQLWVDTAVDDTADTPAAPDSDLVAVVPAGAVPPGFLHVLDAEDQLGRPVALVHADDAALQRMALFDVVIDNADRKGGHVLRTPAGRVHGIDHGVAFNVEPKLRTVLWGWAGEAVPPEPLAELAELADCFDDRLAPDLAGLLAPEEVAATRARLANLVRLARFPSPPRGRPSIPWPAF